MRRCIRVSLLERSLRVDIFQVAALPATLNGMLFALVAAAASEN